MADEARALDTSEILPSLEQPGTPIPPSFPLSVDKSRNRSKFKWLGSLESLKCFAHDQLKLMGNWTFTSNNGGFHVLKAECVTLSFYPNTKTLNVQGMKERETKQKILSFITEEMEDFGPSTDDCDSQDGVEIEGDGDHEGDEVVAQADEDTAERIQETSTLQKNFINCCCDKNMAAIIELSKKFALLEAKIEQRQLSPSYEELLAKIKALEDERDSLLTALRLLKEEFDQNVNDHRNNNSQRGNNDAEWQEVKRSRSNPRRLSGDRQTGSEAKGNNNRLPNRNNNRLSNNSNSTRGEDSQGNRKEKAKVVLVGDSMTKFIQPKKLSRNHHVSSHSFPGATVEDMHDFIKPLLRRKPEKVILHVGTNNVKNDNPKRIKGKITELVDAIRKEQPTVKIAFSSIVHRTDDRSLNRCIDQVNRSMESFSTQSGVDYISQGNISEDCLNSGGLHLNRRGVFNFASNFRKYLNVHSD